MFSAWSAWRVVTGPVVLAAATFGFSLAQADCSSLFPAHVQLLPPGREFLHQNGEWRGCFRAPAAGVGGVLSLGVWRDSGGCECVPGLLLLEPPPLEAFWGEGARGYFLVGGAKGRWVGQWPSEKGPEWLEAQAARNAVPCIGSWALLLGDDLRLHRKWCWHSPDLSCRWADPDLAPQTYDIQGSLQKDSQVTVSVVLENQSCSFLKNMELNVLDSLNTKLARPEGSSVHDGVPVPFQLPPGVWAAGRTPGAGGGRGLLLL